jgi:hypothetical protein
MICNRPKINPQAAHFIANGTHTYNKYWINAWADRKSVGTHLTFPRPSFHQGCWNIVLPHYEPYQEIYRIIW